MRRLLVPGAVVGADVALMVGARGFVLVPVLAYAGVVALIVAARFRFPAAALVAALVLSTVTGVSYIVLLWAAYQAGQAVVSRTGLATIVGSTLGALAVQLALVPQVRGVPNIVAAFAVFVLLPGLAGRYLAEHLRLVSVLDQRARQARQRRELVAEQERLRERLRIARDMHDSLGRRLSLVSIQAAALEVSDLPEREREAVRQLATAARGAVDELYGLIGALRGARDPAAAPSIVDLVADFRAAGVDVTLSESQPSRDLSTVAAQAAYRVVEEGLTNAAKHAPGQPVTVTVAWETDALLLTVTNPVPGPADASPVTGSVTGSAPGGRVGHGLGGLAERVQPVGGLLDVSRTGDGFRLYAMLPLDEPVDEDLPRVGGLRTAAIGVAAAVLLLLLLPASMLMGVR